MSFLAIVSFVLLTQQPPQILSFFPSHEACLVEARLLNHQHKAELDKEASRVLCLKADIGDA
jgi:hypothetical protein